MRNSEEIEGDWEWEIQGDPEEICGDSKKIEGNREWDIQERYRMIRNERFNGDTWWSVRDTQRDH
jgi:hypothetical protein